MHCIGMYRYAVDMDIDIYSSAEAGFKAILCDCMPIFTLESLC